MSDRPRRAMLLAAGYGKRMRPLTDQTPKPLLKAGGKPLLQWHIERLRDAGITELVVNTGWLGDKLETHFGDGSALGVRIQWSREGTPLETAGGIRRALPLLGNEPFLVINGDIWCDADVSSLALRDDDLAQLVLVANPEHNPTGDFHLASDGKVRDNGVPRLTFAGIGLYRPALFSELPEGEAKLAPLLRDAMAKERVSGVRHDGHWWDIGTPERLEQLDKFLGEH